MRIRLRGWQLVGVVLLLAAAAVGVLRWIHISRPYDAPRLLAALPTDHAALLYLDAGVLRKSGILDLLAGSRAAEEADYRAFVEQTGFDYRTDLDAVAAAFVDGSVYLTVRGRFEWPRLSGYAQTHGGACHDQVCTMPGSTPERIISFYPLTADVLALATSQQPRAVLAIRPDQQKNAAAAPPEPVWMSFPPSAFVNPDSLPAGARAFLSPLAKAHGVVFAAGPSGDRLQLKVEVSCDSPAAAAELAGQLSATTALLKKMIQLDHMKANPNDLSGVLVAGTFEQRQTRVIGSWPIERGFVETLAAGHIQ